MSTRINSGVDTPELKLIITRTINAPCALVFRAWTEPEQMVQWWSPEEIECRSVEADSKIGGTYRIHMVSKEGDHIVSGKYTQIIPEKLIQFTWKWETDDMPGTTVTVQFKALENKTQLTLIHEGFVVKEDADSHNGGWSSAIEKFTRLIEANAIRF